MRMRPQRKALRNGVIMKYLRAELLPFIIDFGFGIWYTGIILVILFSAGGNPAYMDEIREETGRSRYEVWL